jgi:parallel beta-helix repeat protein
MKNYAILSLLLTTSWFGLWGQPVSAQKTAQEPAQESGAKLLRVQPRGSLRYNSDGAGFDPYVHFEGFLPLTQQPGKNLTFLEGRLLLSTDNGIFSGNAVLGHRFFSGETQLFTGYLAYDRRNTGNSNFDQIGFGIERLTSTLDLRLNAYFPVGEARSLTNSRLGNTLRLVGDSLGFDRQQEFEVALRGLDVEAGTRLFSLGSGFVWGYVGAYYYRGDSVSGFAGARGRLVARPQQNVEVKLTVQSDSEFGTRAWVTAGLTFPGLPSSRRPDNTVDLATRIAEPIDRQIAVVVTERTITDTILALNPLTNQPFRVIQVDTGAGSFSNLTTLNFVPGDIVLVGIIDPNGDFASTGNVRLANDVQLLSATTNQSITTSLGSFILPALTPSASSPTLRGTVLLANNNRVSGFNITPTNTTGIQGSNISTPTLQNNSITGASTGILLQNVTNPVLINNTVINSAGRGMSLTETTNAQVLRNTVSGAVSEGIGLDNALGTVLIDGNTVRNVTQTATDTNLEAGIFVRNNRGNATITIANNITENNLQSGNRVDGIEVNLCRGDSFAAADRFTDNAFGTCAAPASMTANVLNNQVRRMGTGTDGSDGIDFNLGDGANLTATLSGNAIEDISDAGITFDIVSSPTPVSRPTATINITNNQIRRTFNDDGITLESNTAGAVNVSVIGNILEDIGTQSPNDGIDFEFTTEVPNPTKAVVTIANNQILRVSDRPIEIDTTNRAVLQLTLNNNTLSTTATSTNQSIRLNSTNTSSLFATVNNNTLTQGNATVRSLEVRADDTSRLCANIFQNLQVRGSGFTRRPDDAGVAFQIVNNVNLGAINNGVAVANTGAGTITNITIDTFNAPTPGGCTLP